jgi:hypothetical protein
MQSDSPAGDDTTEHERILVATPLGPEPDDELARVPWARTVVRLALDPEQHPWRRGWRLGRKGPLVVVAFALLVLLVFAASGCASVPPQSLRQQVAAPAPASGARCESVLVSHELQIPAEGELADLRLTIDDLPPALGKLRVLVRRPRFPATLQIESDQKPAFDKVLELTPAPGQRQLTVVLSPPSSASGDWPRETCRACRVDVELTGLFGAREALEGFFVRAVQQATAIDAAFAAQARETSDGVPVRQAADAFAAEAKRCGVSLAPLFASVQRALSELESARARFYGADKADLPDASAVLAAWDAAAKEIDSVPLAAAAARAFGWPSSLRAGSAGRLRSAALHLDLAAQAAALAPDDRAIAAQWIALALSPDQSALERRAAALPRIRDLSDAAARLEWVDPRPSTPVRIPGVSRPATLRVLEWRAAPHGRRCIGRGGAAPVRDRDEEAFSVAAMLGGDDRQRVRVARMDDLPFAREKLRKSRELLCRPLAAEVAPLFAGLAEKDLGIVSERIEAVYAEVDPRRENDELARAVSAEVTDLLCALFDPETVRRRVSSVVGYKIFVDGGRSVLDFVPGPLVCAGHNLPARDIRKRLRDAYRAALDRHGLADRLCPLRGGKCPEEIAASVRRIFGLQRPELAAPGAPRGRALDFPPPFGFGDEWVQKLDRCAREACDALSRLRFEAPPGQFDGPLCAPPVEGSERPQEVTIDRPEQPTSITLSSCDANAGVRLTLRRRPEAGTLVSIASTHQFRYGSENVSRHARHPQLGRIYERVADLTDPGDVSRRPDGAIEVALTPTVDNQVFYFFSLRRRDY